MYTWCVLRMCFFISLEQKILEAPIPLVLLLLVLVQLYCINSGLISRYVMLLGRAWNQTSMNKLLII